MNSRQLRKLEHEAKMAGTTASLSRPPKKTENSKDSTEIVKPTQNKAIPSWLIQAFVASILFGGVSWFSVWQFVNTEPTVTPLDFGTNDPFRLAFDIKNPFYLDMGDVCVGSKPGPGEVNTTGYANWHPDIKPLGIGTCNELRALAADPAEAAKNLLVWSREFPLIEAGKSRVYSAGSMSISKEVASVYGVAISYRLKWIGIPLWKRFSCQQFQAVKDNLGRTHLVSE